MGPWHRYFASIAAAVRCRVLRRFRMLTRHHQALIVAIGVLLAIMAVAIAMNPGIAHSLF